MSFLTQLVTELQALGFYEFLLPWLLTFAIVYGLLTKTGVLGGGKMGHRVSGIVAIVAAFFITPFAGPVIASYFTTLFTGASTILAGILVIVLFAAMAGIEIGWGEDSNWKKNGAVLTFIIVGIVLIILAASGQFIGVPVLGANLSAAALFMILVVILAVAFVLVGGNGNDEDKEST